MTTNGIFVVNTAGALEDCARETFLAAAARWQCGYHECSDGGDADGLHPACWKTRAFQRTGFERVLVIDADAMINSTCQSPFDEFPAHHLTVVSDRQTYCPARDAAEAAEWGIVTRTNPPDRYFNSGVIIATRRCHEDYFDEAHALCRRFPDLTWHDQTPFNVAFRECGGVKYAGVTWNYHNPAARSSDWRVMMANIYHFPGNPDRRQQMREVIWK